jgi:hypothetical protein
LNAGVPNFLATSTKRRRRLGPWCATLALLAAIPGGCRPSYEYSSKDTARSEVAHNEHLVNALNLLRTLEEFEPDQAMSQISYHLNRWLDMQPAMDDWIRDPMIDDAGLGDLRRLASLNRLNSKNINREDVEYLRQCRWLKNIVLWAAELPLPEDMQGRVAAAAAELPAEEADRLAVACRLFDWSVRHIQLDPVPQLPRAMAAEAPPMMACAGFTMRPWETLMLGHGDAWQRARIFTLLARQAEIDAVVLASAPAPQSRLDPWVVAVDIDGKLFLFDPELGLPLPGPGGQGIATLEQIKSDPASLEQLNIGDTLPYSRKPADIAHIVALLDASSESLAVRMLTIESRLTGDDRMALYLSPIAERKKLSSLPGIAGVQIWSVPLEAELFQASMAQMMRSDSQMAAYYQYQRSLMPHMLQARQMHFGGHFDRVMEKPGAVMRYMESRLPEKDIDAIPTDRDVQRRLELHRSPGQTDEDWAARLQLMQIVSRQNNDNAGYWLALTHYDLEDFESASNWLLKRTLEVAPNGPWTFGARYNLARCYEALGRYEEARQQYLLDQSPQRHGNLLRARWIREQKLTE